ncbi:FAD-dependent oxidoreductase [Tsukamurella soli]|uniref:FAD-dependent monooxygenase n=1 Tax=Tsukamurella soli TaxID=644556 RepID=A0ABP8KC90_9ACTN
MATRPTIVIDGAGIGGLALAQALHHAEIDVTVLERDRSPQTRGQGYRLHIDADGNDALRRCLPVAVLDRVRATSGINGDRVTGFTDQLVEVMTQEFPDLPATEISNVDRNTLRAGLLTNLGRVVRFGSTVTGFEVAGDRVHVQTTTGSTTADLLVGADGVGSAVRRTLLPHAVVDDLGLRCIYGRMPLTRATVVLVPPVVLRGFSWVVGGVGLAPVQFRSPVDGAMDYLMTTFVATPARLGVTDEELFAAAPARLRRLAVDGVAGMHATIQEIFDRSDASSYLPIALRAARRVDAWPSGPVTLIGDAIHAMPPTGGVGANTALRDAADLAERITGALSSSRPLREAVAAYEAVAVPRGFDTVDAALAVARTLFGAEITTA